MLKHFIRRSEGIRRESILGSPLREICTAGSDRGARYKPPLGVRPQASTDQVDPVRCEKCGGSMKLVAVILDDRELDRILANQGWPTEFPKTQASRAPPGSAERGEDVSQADPRGEDWDERQDFPSEWPA